jgi:TolB protein
MIERGGRYRRVMWRVILIGVVATALLAPAPGSAKQDGRLALAFSRDNALWLAHADGSDARRIAANGYQPDWSPDGRRLAFVSNRGGRERVYVADADGSNARAVTRGPRDLSPEWSPDGLRIAFAREGRILTVGADGRGERVRIPRILRWHEHTWPAWSRAGFVYASNRPGYFNQELYAAPARRLTFTRGSDGVLGDDGMPAFSPDGRQIAFLSNRTQDGEIWVMNPDGSGQRQVTHRRGDDFYPAWTADGKAIAFAALGTGWIMQVNDDGAGLRRLVRGVDPAFRATG